MIDGQQRLTSLTILLSALASRLADDELRADFQSFICEPGRPALNLLPKPRLTLRDHDQSFFNKYIQGKEMLPDLLKLDPSQFTDEAQQNIQANARLFIKRLDEKFKGDQQRLHEFGTFIVQRCLLVVVTTPSQQSAFRIFSVLNSRGLDLLPTDIIKSQVISQIPAAIRDEYNEKWEEIEIETTRAGLVELLGHVRMIYGKGKARAALLQEFEEIVRPKFADAKSLIDDLIEPCADAFLMARNATYKCESTSDMNAVNGMIHWLNRIDNIDWMPVAIRFIAQKKDESAYVRWFFQRLERLAAYMHICGHYTNDRIDRYAKVLTSLEAGHSNQARALAVELTTIEKAEFRRKLDEPVYGLNARRRNYLILRLDAFFSDGAASYNTDILTIEHVLPQTVTLGSEWDIKWPDPAERDTWVHRIGNLVPLARRTNSSARNLPFREKCTKYFAGKKGVSSYTLTTQVLSSPDWLPTTVQARQQQLLDKFADSWDLA